MISVLRLSIPFWIRFHLKYTFRNFYRLRKHKLSDRYKIIGMSAHRRTLEQRDRDLSVLPHNHASLFIFYLFLYKFIIVVYYSSLLLYMINRQNAYKKIFTSFKLLAKYKIYNVPVMLISFARKVNIGVSIANAIGNICGL